ncbi:MAG: 5-methylcytosine-specific restriction endonuclease system specificity protein McrC [Prevotella sp.]|jgi:5-methylcytosine-specific restriction enzyme subunit McrC|nr:5-methylcytosine-specific restriction endonuclease system specificity protein McrC [Prevotella sp.]MCH3995748.1 5-methylcytosine-specific restriction endonuclease system specificity protein McrC [Prevotella sp.]
MLTYAFQELKQNNYKDIACEDFDNIHDLFAEILARGISYQLKQGLHKEYITLHESLSALKGKLDINGTIDNRKKRNYQLYCFRDELSENCVFNRILKSTVNALMHHPNVKNERHAKLKMLFPFFGNVDLIDIRTIKWTTFHFDRNTRTYQMLLYICRFVLQSILLTTDAGKIRMSGFVDDHLCRLYEKFILEYYRKNFPKLTPEAGQIDWNINKELSNTSILPIMQTDVMLHLPTRTLIIDAKYYGKTLHKHFEKLSIHTNNWNQIQAYVYNLDKGHTGKVDGILLYAKTQEQIVPDDKVVSNDGNVFYFRTLDLNLKFDKIEEQLKKIIFTFMDENQ